MPKETQQAPQLSEALKGKFKLNDYQPGLMRITGFGEVDFTTISLELAQQIADSGHCPHLVAEATEVESKPAKPENK